MCSLSRKPQSLSLRPVSWLASTFAFAQAAPATVSALVDALQGARTQTRCASRRVAARGPQSNKVGHFEPWLGAIGPA